MHEYSFPRTARLLAAAEYSEVFNHAIRSRDGLFQILARKRPPAEIAARLGLAIAKKRVRSAVDRNRIKRLIRESFRQSQHELSGLDIVVMAFTPAAVAESDAIFASLRKHWQFLARKAIAPIQSLNPL